MSGEKLPDINSNANLLNKWGILALGVGGCIGSGVISLLGYGIGRTGHSVWLAFAIALLMGFIICIPVLFVTGSVCLPGGTYSLITAILGKKVAGVYIIAFPVSRCMAWRWDNISSPSFRACLCVLQPL